MIVDVHTRIWESTEALGRGAEFLRRKAAEPWARPDPSLDAHAQAMAPVQAAIIHGYESRHLGGSIPAEKVAQYVSRDPGRYLGFAGIDPTGGGAVRNLEEARALGLSGVTLCPASQGFHPTDSRAMALYEACEAQGVPVFFDSLLMQSRDAKLEFSHPYLLDEVARTFPNLRIVVAGLGHPWLEQGLALVGKHPTVYADLSELILHPWRVYNALLLAYQHGVMGQVLFGSNFPFSTPEKAIVTVYSINTFTQGTHLPAIPREQLRSIVERDALACLGLTPPAGEPAPRPASEPQEAASPGDETPAPPPPQHART